MSLHPVVRSSLFYGTLLVGFLGSWPAFGDEPAQPFDADQLEFFEKQIRPLLAEHCYSCHSNQAETIQAGLLVDSRQGLLVGGDSGEAVMPGDPQGSLFMEAIRYESFEMPPKGKLADTEIDAFERWIAMGAPWPQEDAPSVARDRPKFDLQARRDEQWAWQPIAAPAIPSVNDSQWPKTDVDHFILAQLEANGLKPVGDAERLAILRRLYHDLIGLPPTVEQVDAFLADDSAGALERVVDELLSSPHFGERWGRHWLDLVRYAESRGHEFDNDTPNAFQYRDYIIRALNADVPYDQLVREHIAGDLLTEPRLHPTAGFNESILGTGFWFFGEWVHSPVDIRKDETDRFDNMIDVMSKTFLGVTVACARCHDHKFDPISTADYYSMAGFLQSSDYRQVRFESIETNRQVAQQLAELDAHYQKAISDLLFAANINRPQTSDQPADIPGLVFDYGRLSSQDYLQDGYTFAAGPRQAGQLYLNAQGEVTAAVSTTASNDPFWNGLKSITEGALQNNSQLDKLPRSGRTLRTPTFEVKEGEIACFVEGEGHVVACVDSHRLIFGPLHGQTIVAIPANQPWVKLNLQRYVGHRVHLEFIPAEDAQLSVRMIVQGLDNQQLNQLNDRLRDDDTAFLKYASDVESYLGGAANVSRQVFADFESGSYDGWQATGHAFGKIPQTAQTIADYQGDVNHRGTFFVNSHNLRNADEAGSKGDALTGTLTSPNFTIDCQEIEFLVGGGAHVDKTCVNLLVDDKVVRSTTGKNANRMTLEKWDVRPFQGKLARIQIVDAHEGGWGNIGADEFTFVSMQRTPSVSPQATKLVAQWRSQRETLRNQVQFTSRLAPAMLDGSGEDDHVLIRGSSSNPGPIEPRHFLTAICGNDAMEIPVGSGRLQLAAEINDAGNPLTHRVIVNRIWHHLFGRGIVATTDDFGVLGGRPTHPALLDHLATKFTAEGQSIKRMIRYLVLSRTYQLSSIADPRAVAQDPNNELWHHRPPKRLEGEVIRDSLLALAGNLDPTQYGQPVPIHLTNFMDGRGRPGINGPIDGQGRRSIYISVRRNFLSPFMLAFDMPVPFSTMGRRNVSNVPAQALILMNDPFVVDQAHRWARRAQETFPSDLQQRIQWLYLSAFARNPTEREMAVATQYVGTNPEETRWLNFAHALINTKEFIYLR